MPLPAPNLGLVVHCGFVWAGAGRRAPPDTGKDRPCLIVDLEQVEEPALNGRVTTRVTYLPISHVAPRQGEQAIALPPRVARHLGLTYGAVISLHVVCGRGRLAVRPGARSGRRTTGTITGLCRLGCLRQSLRTSRLTLRIIPASFMRREWRNAPRSFTHVNGSRNPSVSRVVGRPVYRLLHQAPRRCARRAAARVGARRRACRTASPLRPWCGTGRSPDGASPPPSRAPGSADR